MRIIGYTGDSSPIEHGGTLVLETGDCIHFSPDPENDNQVWVNQFEAEQLKPVGDIQTKTIHYVSVGYTNSWVGGPADRDEWFASDIAQACESYGVSVDEFWCAITDDQPAKRAWAYDVIGSYWGFHELSAGYEETETVAENRKRFGLPCWQARKRGIHVYA